MPIESRLDEADAIRIAQEAAGQAGHLVDHLVAASFGTDAEGRAVWTVRRPVIGSSLEVTIEDASGTVLRIEARPGR